MLGAFFPRRQRKEAEQEKVWKRQKRVPKGRTRTWDFQGQDGIYWLSDFG